MPKDKPPTELHSTRKIVDALGGPKEVAWLTNVGVKAVYYWINTARMFPSHTYCIMQVELFRRGYYARPHLWTMTGFAKKKKRRASA